MQRQDDTGGLTSEYRRPLTAVGFTLPRTGCLQHGGNFLTPGCRMRDNTLAEWLANRVACQHSRDPETCPRCTDERRREDSAHEHDMQVRCEWERRMREQQRCYLDDATHERKRGAPQDGPYQSIPNDGSRVLRIGARGLPNSIDDGMIGMYWDFGDEPPGISHVGGHCFYRTAIAADGEEVREKVTNIRCDRCSLDRRCDVFWRCVERRQWRQQQLLLKAQQDMLVAARLDTWRTLT